MIAARRLFNYRILKTQQGSFVNRYYVSQRKPDEKMKGSCTDRDSLGSQAGYGSNTMEGSNSGLNTESQLDKQKAARKSSKTATTSNQNKDQNNQKKSSLSEEDKMRK